MEKKESERCSIDDIIDLYEKDVDETLIMENLKLTPEQRLKKMEDFINTMELLRESYLKTKKSTQQP
ncbi:MAG: hypothetical protein MUD14_19035 [Hydrococcus sp. Prado102]|jgi:hypothetical protein|nr:hypothetical protein [Hydrococcus sp. Prado102]